MMSFCRKTVWLLVAAAALLPAGCAAQRGRMASKQQFNTAQLLAAARQYEKEGNVASAKRIYQHVLQFHPTNSEAKEGLALVQQGKLRVQYDTKQLLASTDPTIQSNPQAREQLAKIQDAKREQVSERMAELIAQAAQNPTVIKSEPTLAQQNYAKAMAEVPAEAAASKAPPAAEPTVAQAEAVAEKAVIAPTGFVRITEETPVDWADDGWKSHSLTDKCRDANAAILDEIRKLESPADGMRKDGLTNLAEMGTEAISAAPAIVRLLKDQNQLVAAHAAWALWEVNGDAPTAVEHLQSSLDSTATNVVQFAAYTLGKMGSDAASAAGPLQGLLGSADQFTQLHAAEALGQVGNSEQRADATDTLIVLLNDDDAGIRQLSAVALGQADQTNAEAAVIALTAALDDTDAGVRAAAALSLGAFGQNAARAAARLEQSARTDLTEVREAATTALACIKLEIAGL